MGIVIFMVNMLMSRFFGFRHREIAHDDTVYRTRDVGAGVGLALLFALLGSTLADQLGRSTAPPIWLRSITTACLVASAIAVATLWMPFIEHLSMAAPGDMTARGRHATVILARAIPYLYGIVALGFAIVLTVMIEGMLGFALIGVAEFLGFDPAALSPHVWAWIIGVVGLFLVLFLTRYVMMQARLNTDWGLPVWRTFVEPRQQRGAGAWVFDPLDATLGRLVRSLTVPTATMREAVANQPEQHRLSAYRRFPGDLFDLTVSLCVAVLVLYIVTSACSALLSLIAPHILAMMQAPTPPTTAPGSAAKQINPKEVAMFFGMALILLSSMLGFVFFLQSLAMRSTVSIWAQQRWVRWLARILDVARMLSCAGAAFLISGALVTMVCLSLPIPQFWMWVAFVAFALAVASGLLHMPPGEESALLTFLSNVAAANRPEPPAPSSPEA